MVALAFLDSINYMLASDIDFVKLAVQIPEQEQTDLDELDWQLIKDLLVSAEEPAQPPAQDLSIVLLTYRKIQGTVHIARSVSYYWIRIK